MTQDTNATGGAAIKRYKIGYHTDEWGVRSSTPGGITDPSGQWVLYKDHIAALAYHGQAPAQAAPADVAGPEREALLFEHEDGRYAVNPNTAGDPKWHRMGPVDVSAINHPACQYDPVAWHSKQYGTCWVHIQPYHLTPGMKFYVRGRSEPVATVVSGAAIEWHVSTRELAHGTFFYPGPVSASPDTQPAPQQEATDALARSEYYIDNPSAWSSFDQRISDDISAVTEALRAALAAPKPQQEAQEPVAWYVTRCGRLLDEYDAEAEARRIGGTAKAMPLYTVPQPSPASQGDALDAVETKRYADGTTATGIGPLPKHSPSVQHALRVLIDVESMLGGANGPTIQIRAVLESLAAQEGKSHG